MHTGSRHVQPGLFVTSLPELELRCCGPEVDTAAGYHAVMAAHPTRLAASNVLKAMVPHIMCSLLGRELTQPFGARLHMYRTSSSGCSALQQPSQAGAPVQPNPCTPEPECVQPCRQVCGRAARVQHQGVLKAGVPSALRHPSPAGRALRGLVHHQPGPAGPCSGEDHLWPPCPG